MDMLPGPDGFLLSRTDPLFAFQQKLSDFLAADEARDPSRTMLDPGPWKKLPKREAITLIEATLRRLNWLCAHDAELDTAHMARHRLIQLLRVLYKIKLPCTEADLRAQIELTVPLMDRMWPDGPLDYLAEYLKKNDLTPELCSGLRQIQGAIKFGETCGQAALQSLAQRLHMLLWMDEWEPLDPSRCWSECIRRDFRAMTGERQVAWRALLKHLRGNAPPKMPAGWAREAEPLLAAVGLNDFRQQFCLWFAPFQSGQPLPLSVAGSHVLKCMLWYASLTRDDEVRECALWLLDVKWKQKRNTAKSMIALEVFGITKEELLARSLIKPEARSSGPSLLEKFLKAQFVHTAGRIAPDPEGGETIIQGELHFYRVNRSKRRIQRASDNAVLELDWPSVPDSMRMSLTRECDSEEQLMLRAHLLLHDSYFGRFFVASKR
jgi:hypothetical protein